MSHCPDCGAKPGQMHEKGCDVERCPACGHQLIGCDCSLGLVKALGRMPWTGEWPGDAECREYGWYTVLVPEEGWVSCPKGTPGATEDLSRLVAEGVWDRETRRFERPKAGGER
jgi:hypothetical protein